MPGGGGSAWLKKISEPRSGEENCFWPSRGPAACSRKIFKIKGPRLATNVFPEILAWKT